jgi:hypothetical protein
MKWSYVLAIVIAGILWLYSADGRKLRREFGQTTEQRASSLIGQE